jgi:hypothetical protein
MEDETHGIIQKMSKIDINKDEKDAEEVINRAVANNEDVTITKDQRTTVFKAIL